MSQFPRDAPKRKVIHALERLGFRLVREGNHIAMLRENPDGSRPPLNNAQPSNHQEFNVTNLLPQAQISKEQFLKAYTEH